MKRIIAALGLLVFGLAACTSPPTPTAAPHHYSAPFRPGSGSCSADASTSLATYLTNLPDNSTVTLAHACYTLSTTLLLQGINGLTIHGNGAKLALTIPDGGFVPVIELWNSKNIKIDNLTLDGGSTPGDRGGEDDEGDYGIMMESDTNVLLTQDTIQNIQGDWIFMSQPYDTPPTAPQINTGITFSNDIFDNAGYHGITVESVGCPTQAPCNGMTIANSTLSHMSVDAMDFEVDVYSSGIDPVTGATNFSVENYVTIKNNVWNDWGDDWFASIQGQTPGVAEQHLTITGNTLNANGALFEVVGTFTYATTSPYLNYAWTITNNHFGPGFYTTGYRGGSTQAGQLYSVAGIIMKNNVFPWCPGGPPCIDTPGQYEFDLFNSTYSTISNNNFRGAVGTIQPQTYNEYDRAVTVCGNIIGARPGHNDASC